MKRPILALLLLALVSLACSLTPTANLSGTISTATPIPSPAPVPTAPDPTATPEPIACRVTAIKALNVRSAPSTEGDVIAWLLPGDVVTISSTRGAWYQVKTDRGTGYIYSKYCEVKP